MEDRTRQFKEASENPTLTGSTLVKEINTLRKFLFRNQDYRFTKSEQQNIFLAVTTHGNNFLKARQDGLEDSVISLLDDALKMPFTVFSTAHKERMLQMYYSLLGGESKPVRAGPAPTARFRTLDLVDMDQKDTQLLLLDETGDEYPHPIAVSKSLFQEIRELYDEGSEVAVTVKENGDDIPTFVSHACH